MTDQYRLNQLDRMKTGVCSGEACVIYSEMLTDFERLGDHMLNIAEAQEMVPEVVTAPARKTRNDKKA